MNTGGLWVANPLFPWLVVTLALWVSYSTVVMMRNWIRIRKLEQLVLVQEIAQNNIEQVKTLPKSVKEAKQNQTKEEPAAIEIDEDMDDFTDVTSEDTERTSVKST